MEAIRSLKDTLVPEHEDTVDSGVEGVFAFDKRKYNFRNPLWDCSMYDPFEASEFVFLFQEMIRQLMVIIIP